MEDAEKPLTRKYAPRLRVPVLPHEKELIERKAKSTGLPVAVYLRNVGMGYEVRSVLDYQYVSDMALIDANLGRLGGLLKLWLTNDERLKKFSQADIRKIIARVLSKIEGNQEALRAVIKTVIKS